MITQGGAAPEGDQTETLLRGGGDQSQEHATQSSADSKQNKDDLQVRRATKEPREQQSARKMRMPLKARPSKTAQITQETDQTETT
jgi:hypothetical protein